MTINIEIFASPGCGKCGHAKDVLRKLVEELALGQIAWREVNILDEIDHAVALGVMTTPSIAINGDLVFTSLPSAKKLREVLEQYLQKDGEPKL
ncbi:hypothetical protein MNBD_GAMMA22-848 [hydrothermal vent metagenome]|uniref:Thioredoxin-like fold domain-containing protein n=1 Tax=hydrothermal vent metagenome TaxID=652676 RepID=A0A3B0ZWD7_9ZZZZ